MKYIKKALKIIGFVILFLGAFVYVFFQIETKVTENTDDYIYDLPYKKGETYKVVQGYGGLFSHKNIAAIDFLMPVGTPILAAREGTVYSYKDNSNQGGLWSKYKNKANYIIIKHTDGSYGCYWHLKQSGVVKKSGSVNKGELIGYSGKTGYVLSPHLHFSVKTVFNYKMNSFIKTKFKTAGGNSFLKKGNSYINPAN